jgi:hypothetical protein
MDYSAISTAVSHPIYANKMLELAASYGLPSDKGFSLATIEYGDVVTGNRMGFALIIKKDGKNLIETDRLTEDPYGFWTRRALKKIVKRAIKVAA